MMFEFYVFGRGGLWGRARGRAGELFGFCTGYAAV